MVIDEEQNQSDIRVRETKSKDRRIQNNGAEMIMTEADSNSCWTHLFVPTRNIALPYWFTELF